MKKVLLLVLVLATTIFHSCNKEETPDTDTISVGEFYQGGIVFFLDDTGKHGLVCSISNQSYGSEWGCLPTLVTDAKGLSIGTGYQNTIDITNTCTSNDIAAAICNNLTLNDYDDWFLPSKDELNEIHQNLDVINAASKDNGGEIIQSTNYWTSSSSGGDAAWVQNMDSGGNQYSNLADKSNHVRAIRKF